MQHTLLGEVQVAFNYLLDDVLGLGLLYFFLLVQQLHEVAMGTVLGNDVVEILGFVGVVELNYVGMAQGSMHFYLALEHRYV